MLGTVFKETLNMGMSKESLASASGDHAENIRVIMSQFKVYPDAAPRFDNYAGITCIPGGRFMYGLEYNRKIS